MLHSLLFQMIDLMFVRCSLRSLMEKLSMPPPLLSSVSSSGGGNISRTWKIESRELELYPGR